MTDISLVPVDHDPWADAAQSTTDRAAAPLVSLQPVDHDPFFSADIKDPYASAAHEVLTPGQREGFADAYQTFVKPTVDTITAPGRILSGQMIQGDPDFEGSAMRGAALLSPGALTSGPEAAAMARMGYGGPSKAALDMETAVRLARAKSMGFYPNMPLYHGTDATFEAFDPALAQAKSSNPAARSAIFVAGDPQTAGEFVGTASPGSSPQMMKLLHRADKPASIALDGTETNQEIAATLQDAFDRGHDAVRMTNYTTPSGATGRTIFAIKDPSQLRSVNAAFDPARRYDPNLLAARGTPLAVSLQPVDHDPFAQETSP